MLKKLLISCALVFTIQFFAPAEAAAQCGGPGQVPCYEWSWCAYTTPSIFGDVCWGGLVPSTPWAGCSNDRLNNWGLVCVPCGSAGEPTCAYGPVCDTDRRYTPFGLCFPCGQTGEAACLSGPACDPGNRAVFGFCSYSGFSNEPTTNVASMPTLTQSATAPVRGIADLHTHQFSNLGFGGVVMWGAPYDSGGINEALPWCDYTWDFSIKNSFLNIDAPVVPFLGYEAHGPRELQPVTHIVSNGIPEGSHSVAGTGPFDGWPTYNTYTHQQMYHKWVERAFQGGLRLMVLHMVSNEALCRGSKRRSNFSCNDMEAVDRQIQAAKELERAIDLMDDGAQNGSGWYRIAYSPSQARALIRAGKMAVVLGIEVDSLFNCKPGTPCSRAYLRGELQRYYNMGIRHVYPIHQFDNAFGGAAIFRDELNAGNAIVTGQHFTVRDCQAQGYDYNVNPSTAVDIFGLLTLGVPPPNAAYYNGFAADCNAGGLSAAGTALIEEMIDLKFIIDIDHMSRSMMDSVLEMARTTSTERPNKYPLVSGHSSFLERNGAGARSEFSVTAAQIDIIKEIGGMITVGNPRGDCGNTSGFKAEWDYAVGKMKQDAADTFPGVGFTTDMNGFGGSTGPRFSGSPCAGTQANPLPYPFNGVLGGTFNAQVTGGRTFNFNTQGLAHYGLLADFFADLPRAGMTAADMDVLLNSAETYIRMWEAIDNSDRLPPPTVTAQITGTAGLNGWYRSNVTLDWNVTAADGITPILSGCGSQQITTDTAGVTFTCQATNPGTGESASSSVTIKRDATPATYTATRLTAAPASGWTNQNVRVRFVAADNLSGFGGPAVVEVDMTQEGANRTAQTVFTDRAGNTTVAVLGGINIDKTRPEIGFRFAHLPLEATPAQIAAEQVKWHNQAVTLLVDARDLLAGIATVTPAQIVFSVQGTNLVATATATDLAGNVVSDTSDPIRIDLTPPTIALVSRIPAANTNGWNRTHVTTTWQCADALSGVQQPTVVTTLAGEGGDQSANGTCVDQAGNTQAASVDGINIDMTAPLLDYGAQQPPANANGWNNTPVAIPFTATDALSGVQQTSIPSPLQLSAEGAAVAGTVSVLDRAGNEAQFGSPAVKIDTTAPAITFVDRLPLANAAGWNNTDITIRWSCADALSGPASPIIAETLSAEGAGLSLTGKCLDLAGNLAANTRGGLNLDKTAPSIACTADPAFVWPPNNRMIPVNVAMTFTDALAGTQGFSLITAESNEPENGAIANFTLGAPDLSGEVRAKRLGGGTGRMYTLGYRGFDLAGNSATCSTTVRVPHDMSEQQQQ